MPPFCEKHKVYFSGQPVRCRFCETEHLAAPKTAMELDRLLFDAQRALEHHPELSTAVSVARDEIRQLRERRRIVEAELPTAAAALSEALGFSIMIAGGVLVAWVEGCGIMPIHEVLKDVTPVTLVQQEQSATQ